MPTYQPGMTILGRFEVKARLGAGAMGIVFGAVDHKLEEEVALKFLPPAMVEDVEAVQQFAGEVRRARRVSGPFILRVYDMWDDGEGGHFVTMEWAKGGDLKAYRLSRGLLSWDETKRLMVPVLKGLQTVHDVGIIHRDVKPGNILFREDGTPVVADFGISKTIMTSMSRISQDAAISGTPAYMAPEAVQGTADVGFATDLYAVGCVAYELLVGHTPFHGEAMSVMYSQMHVDPSFEGLSDAATRWIGACLIKKTRRRVQTANELLRSLDDPWQLPEYAPLQPVMKARLESGEAHRAPSPEEAALLTHKVGVPPASVRREGLAGSSAIFRRAWDALTCPRVLPWTLGTILLVLVILVLLVGNSSRLRTVGTSIRGSEPSPRQAAETRVTEAKPEGSERIPDPLAEIAEPNAQAQITALEEEAQRLFHELKFTSGTDGNAWDICRQILELDSGNAICRQLITDMKKQYRSWIESSLASGACDKAATYAASLSQIGGTADYEMRIADCRQRKEAPDEVTGICPYCGDPTVEGKFCTGCGRDLEDLTVVCPRCLKWTADEKFCIHCRQRLK